MSRQQRYQIGLCVSPKDNNVGMFHLFKKDYLRGLRLLGIHHLHPEPSNQVDQIG